MDVYIGFDSAWTDNPKAPGAICAIAIKDRQPLRFYAPQFVSFNQALTFIKSVSADDGITLIAPADRGSQLNRHAASRPGGRFPRRLAWRWCATRQPRKAGHVLQFLANLVFS